MESLLFYLFSAVSLASAFCVITLRKPTRALLALIVTMFSLAVLYLLLGAYFVAMVHLIVYAGAVLVLFLFVIMLQGTGAQDIPLHQRFHKGYTLLATFVGLVFLGTVTFLLKGFLFPTAATADGSVEAFAAELFQRFLLPFELASLLLLLGVFAALALAKEPPALRADRPGGDSL